MRSACESRARLAPLLLALPAYRRTRLEPRPRRYGALLPADNQIVRLIESLTARTNRDQTHNITFALAADSKCLACVHKQPRTFAVYAVTSTAEATQHPKGGGFDR